MCRCNPSIKDLCCGRLGCHYPRPEPKAGMLYEPCGLCARFAQAGLQCLKCLGVGFTPTGVSVKQLERLLTKERAETETPSARPMPKKGRNKV